MATAYSMDLRERVIKDADAGVASKALAGRYHVSRAWVDALKQRWRETGSIAPQKQTRFRRRVLAGQEDRLRGLVTAQPDATLVQLREAQRTSAVLATIWRQLHRLDLTIKKNRARGRTTTAWPRRPPAALAGPATGARCGSVCVSGRVRRDD